MGPLCSDFEDKRINSASYGASQLDRFGLDVLFRKFNADTKKLMNKSLNPRNGDFESALGKLNTKPELARLEHRIAATNLSRSLQDWTQASALSLRYYVWLIQTRGRFNKDAKNYIGAKSNFNMARIIYEVMLDNRSIGCIEPFKRDFDRMVIRHSIDIRSNRKIIRNYINDKSRSDLAQFRLGYADLLQSMIFEDDIVPDQWVVNGPSTGEDRKAKLEKNLRNHLLYPLLKAKKELTEAEKVAAKILTGDKGLVTRDISRAKQRIPIVTANYLLEAAKRLKLKNHALALDVTNKAIRACEVALKNGLSDKEVLTSAIMTLGWAYATKANLEEEKERQTGKANAETSAGIYRLMLYGDDSMLPKETKKLLSDYTGKISFISNSWKNITNGGGYTAKGIDILKRLAINEVDLALSYANSLKSARRFNEAVTEYDKILGLEKRGGSLRVRDLTFFRAHNGLLNAKVARADKNYFETARTKEVVFELRKVIKNGKKVLSRIASHRKKRYSEFLYTAEKIKVRDTVAWAWAAIGRIKKAEQGEGVKELKEALKIYSEIQRSLSPSIRRAEINDVRLNVETTLNDGQLGMRFGDLYRDLKLYDKSSESYNKVDRSDVFYRQAKISQAQANVDKFRYDYLKSGSTSFSLKSLKRALDDFGAFWNKEKKNMSDTERYSAALFVGQLYSKLGWLKVRSMNRKGAHHDFKRALKMVSHLDTALSNKTGKAKIILENLYQSTADFKMNMADLLKVAGERDNSKLKEAKTAYEAAERYLGSKTEQSPRVFRGLVQARMGKLEIIARMAKNYLWDGNFDEAKLLLAEVVDKKEYYLKLAELLADPNRKELGGTRLKRLAFRAYSSLAFCFGMLGGFNEKMEGEGQGAADFQKALKLYKDMATEKDGGSLVYGDEFLLENDMDRSALILTQADLLKASGNGTGDKKLEKLLGAIKKYKESAKMAQDKFLEGSPISFLLKNVYYQSLIGIVETYIALGKKLEEASLKPEEIAKVKNILGSDQVSSVKLADEVYVLAAKYANQIIKRLNREEGKIEDLSRASIGLRAIKAFAGAMGSLGSLREEWQEVQNPEIAELMVEYKMALLAYHQLINGDSDNGIWKSTKALMGKAINPVLNFIDSGKKGERQLLIDDEVLYDTDTSPWSMPFAYIGLLSSSRYYKKAIQKYEETRKDISGRKAISLQDRNFVAQIETAIGDLFSYKMRKYGEATIAYDNAQRQLDHMLGRPISNLKKVKEVKRSLALGRAKIAIEKGRYEEALTLYNSVLSYVPKNKPTFKDKRDWARAKLSLGDVYNYHLKDVDKAEENYKAAKDFLADKRKYVSLNIMYSQSYLGLGDVSRLRKMDYRGAIKKYDAGIAALGTKRLNTRESAKLLAQLYTAKADALINIGGRDNYNKAKELIIKAKKAIEECKPAKYALRDGKIYNSNQCREGFPNDPYDKDREDIEKRIKATLASIDKMNFDNPEWGVSAELGYVFEDYDGNKGEGLQFQTGLKKCFGPNHCLNLDYKLSDLNQTILTAYGTQTRFENGLSHMLELGYKFRWQNAFSQEWLTFSANPTIKLGSLDFKTTKYDWGNTYPSPESKNEEQHKQLTVTPGIGIGAMTQFNISDDVLFQGNAGLDLAYMSRSGDNASIIAKIGKEEDKKSDKVVKYNNDDLRAIAPQAKASLLVPSIHLGKSAMLLNTRVSAGYKYERNEITASSYGRWMLDETMPLNRHAFTFSIGTEVSFGSSSQWRIGLASDGEIGPDHFYTQGSFSLARYDLGLELKLTGSHFELNNYNQSSSEIKAGLGWSF